jgi:hypothetical protein
MSNIKSLGADEAYGLHAMAQATGRTVDDIRAENIPLARCFPLLRKGNSTDNVRLRAASDDSDDVSDGEEEPSLDTIFRV